MAAITIKDIAKALNLSASTVSRALRDSYEIGAATKKLVHDYAQQHHYSPNPIALGLKENKTRAIGIQVPEIDNPFFSQAINGIESVAHDSGYHVLIFQSSESLEREKANLQQMLARRVDGVILSVSAQTNTAEHINEILSTKPLVLFDRIVDDAHCHKVVANSFKAAYEATEYLIRKGKKRIAVIGLPPHLSISKERYGGYLAAIQHYGIAIDPKLICNTGYDIAQIETDIAQLLTQKPDALLSLSDRQAMLCLQALSNRGIIIPSQLSYFCFSNLRMAHLFNPPLNTISQRAFEMGQKAAKLLIEQLQSKHPERIEFQTVRIDADVNIRGSVS
jgi:LacI family transcriptional regulator